MIYVCPHCGAEISPKSETKATKIKGTCPLCKQKVEFVSSEGREEVKFTVSNSKQETKPKANNKKKWNRVALIIILVVGGIVAWNMYDDYQRRESYRRISMEQQYYNTSSQPSFGSSGPSKYSNRETCRSHHCPCKVKRSWLDYKGYTTCPDCNDPVSFHHD